MLKVTEEWKSKYPGAMMGILAIRNVCNPPSHAGLEQEKGRLERRLREAYSTSTRKDLIKLPGIWPYVEYYRGYKKTYHVLLQLESVVMEGKPIPRTAALVEAMFMAELKDHLLTAGHDLAFLQGDATLGIAAGGEIFPLINGKDGILKEGDMLVRDEAGILSSILCGPDFRARIRESTTSAFFTVYAPRGIPRPLLEQHLDDLEKNVRIVSPAAKTIEKAIYPSES
jgi:DNA/RNA-binding domain of Phe-tRNA-synthetase-like protein